MDPIRLREEYEAVEAELRTFEAELCRQNQALWAAERSLRQTESALGIGLFGAIKRLFDPEPARQLRAQLDLQLAAVAELKRDAAVVESAAACVRVRKQNLIDDILTSTHREFQTFLPRSLAARRANGKCELCGRDSARARMRFHVHHVKPRAQGGDGSLANALYLCEKCHGQQSEPGHQYIRGRLRRQNAARETRANLGAAYDAKKALNQIRSKFGTALRAAFLHGDPRAGTGSIGKPECWLEPSGPNVCTPGLEDARTRAATAADGLRGVVSVPGYSQFREVRAVFDWSGDTWVLKELEVGGLLCRHGLDRDLLEARIKVVAALDVLRMQEECRVSTAAYWNQLGSSCDG